MRAILSASLFALALSGSALAQGRPSTTDMTCQQARATVDSAGAIVLGTGGPTFDRFVSSQAFCTHQEIARSAWARTRDTPACIIGYTCEPAHGNAPQGR